MSSLLKSKEKETKIYLPDWSHFKYYFQNSSKSIVGFIKRIDENVK